MQGATFDRSHGAFTFQAGVSVPIFTGGRIKGEITEAEADLRKRRAEAENLRGQIDYDVRTAFLNLQAAKEQVAVARQNVDLANENLGRSKERFAAGVTDSVEVVQAEQSLASANDQYITSLTSHNVAKLQLARALGVARTDYSQYLSGKVRGTFMNDDPPAFGAARQGTRHRAPRPHRSRVSQRVVPRRPPRSKLRRILLPLASAPSAGCRLLFVALPGELRIDR